MQVDQKVRDWILKVHKEKKVYLEGNILKVIEADASDTEFQEYLTQSLEKDKDARRKRLEVTRQVQERNNELIASEAENLRINEELKEALEAAEKATQLAEEAKEAAVNDLDLMQKKSQFELIGTIVRVALYVILGVGFITTGMYAAALFTGLDTQIIGSTWSNMLGILLTNAFSIVGTIMGVKYASENSGAKPE
jgi:hypothetical protein